MLSATLVILNANVVTLDSKQPVAEAIAIYDGKIVAVGSKKDILQYLGKKTKVIDAKDKTVVPGLVDCHVHMTSFGWSLQELNLRDVDSTKKVQQKLKKHAEKNPHSKWILGGRWDQEKFAGKRYPTRWDLDSAVADKPVFLVRVCGHLGVANSKALQLAGITRETLVDGGKIDLDEAAKEPNGILRENALELIWKAIPTPSLKELESACLSACRKAVEAGLTGVHWLVNSADEIRVIQRLDSKGKLPLRVYLGVPAKFLDKLVSLGFLTGFGNDMLKIGFVKFFADGSLGARTAALKEPYSDNPKTKGMLLNTQKKLNKAVLKTHEAGLQLGIHAIGDEAIDSVLKAYTEALKQFPRKNHRHRIEHCSVVNPELVKRMKRLGLTVSVQPHFVVSDFWVVDRVGKARARWVYPFKTFTRENSIVVAGSDCPVEPINPLLGMWAAVARKSFAEEKLTVKEALKMYTSNAAYASFDEDKKGTIETGKLADFTVLSDNLFGISAEKIKNVSVKMTIVAGKVVYSTKNC
jgi:predicted amidohydrolase YtcJ